MARTQETTETNLKPIYIEREVNLSLLNDKLNEVLRQLSLIAEKNKVDLNPQD